MDQIQSFGDRISDQALRNLSLPTVRGFCQLAAGFFATYVYHLYLDFDNCKTSRSKNLAKGDSPSSKHGYNTDVQPDDTDADELLMKDNDLTHKFRNNMGDWSADSPHQTIQRYDISAIPGATVDPDYAEPGTSAPKKPSVGSVSALNTHTGDSGGVRQPSVFGDVAEMGQPSTSKQHAVISNRPVSRAVASSSNQSSGSPHIPSISQPTQTEEEQVRIAVLESTSIDCQTEIAESSQRREPYKTEASISVQSFFPAAAIGITEKTSQQSVADMKQTPSSGEIYHSHTSPTLPELSVGIPSTSKNYSGGASVRSKKSLETALTGGTKTSSQSFEDALLCDTNTGMVNMSGVFSKNVTQPWVDSLEIVTAPARGLYADNSLENVITNLLTKIANDDVQEEFKQLKSLKPTDNSEVAKHRENKTKNRFRNVLPFDVTRVILNNEDDYINASHIQKAMGKDAYQYIASQGPMPQTADDFWEMVIEQGITIILMATQDVEGGKVKCHRYWPDSPGTPMCINDAYEVSLLKVMELNDYDVRHLEVFDLDTQKKHRVIHMNYTRWPDHGVPESAIPLLQYIRVMHELHSSGPILVHCSAGIGRTGTLITMDIVLGSIERDLKFDIHQIVTDLRRQRPGMIQTKDQYLFCYTATLEALESLR